MGIARTVSEIIKYLLFSWLRSVWPWMKVQVNIINTWCILMSEAVTLPSLMMMALIASEDLLARDRHTHTHRLGVVYLNLSLKTLKTKRETILSHTCTSNTEIRHEKRTQSQQKTKNPLPFCQIKEKIFTTRNKKETSEYIWKSTCNQLNYLKFMPCHKYAYYVPWPQSKATYHHLLMLKLKLWGYSKKLFRLVCGLS